jgi:LPXTG-motif cell wall-anchored protein
MKRFLKKAAVIFLTAVLMAGVYAPVASAATSKVIIHVQDGQAWGSMNVYNYGDDGEIAGVWPGTEMTAEADGWYTYTLEATSALNLVFSAKGGAPQSSDVKEIPVDSGEIWVVIGGAGEANDMGAATNEAVLYTEPEEGWPAAAAAETATEDTSADTTTTEVPKTGENTALAVTFLGLAALSATAVVVMKKKERVNEI